VNKGYVSEKHWVGERMALGDAQSTVKSENQTICAARGTKRTRSIAGRLHDNTTELERTMAPRGILSKHVHSHQE